MSSPSTGSFITDGTSVALPVISPDPIPVTATSGNTADEIQQAVLYQVDDPNKPMMASVLLKNRFPAVAGFSVPPGNAPIFVDGTTSYTNNGKTVQFLGPFFTNPKTLTGGSFVLVNVHYEEHHCIPARNFAVLSDLGPGARHACSHRSRRHVRQSYARADRHDPPTSNASALLERSFAGR
jgi:hypothetical protein